MKNILKHCSPAARSAGRKITVSLFLLFLSLTLLCPAYGAPPTYPISSDVYTTLQRTIRPLAIPGAQELTITEVDQYAAQGYTSYDPMGAPVDYGPLLPNGGAAGARTPVETLLNFFSISDIHITDKESPAQSVYPGTVAPYGNVNTSAYSPVILSTTHVLDAAIQTVNALHVQTPFDFGISLGDDANNTQYNELRWFIDVIDGKRINPSSGAHKGAGSIDYQRPYQAAGLDKSIPWYVVIGNHDQYWLGTLTYTDYVRRILTGPTILDIGLVGAGGFPTFESRGFYVGTIDGATPLGTIIGAGADGTITPPLVAADPSRRSLSTDTSTSLKWMREFFNTTSHPKGHGLTQANLDRDWASYTFEPKSNVPVKVIVLDDTCKENPYAIYSSYARGCLDQERYDWLINELELGQAQGKLMIIAAHIPVGPQTNVPDAPVPANAQSQNVPNDTVIPLFISTCNDDSTPVGVPCQTPGAPIANNDPVPPYSVVTDAMLLQTLHNYSNVILWISGHRHINTVTPQPGPSPEFGFWEVETSSLRDHPQQFRTFNIVRNAENTVSIFVTNVDPAVQGDSPAAKSRGYSIAAGRIAAGTVGQGLTDTTPHVFNAELIKPLATPYTMTVNVTGPGTVAMGPYQAATCAVGTPCTGSYLPGTQVTLTPTPGSGAAFAGWSACAGKSTCTITMTGNIAVTATFTSAPTAAVTPLYKNFGNVRTGRTAIATFTVKNTATKGIADLTITDLSITSTTGDADQFSIVAGKDRCSGRTLAPGRTCTFQAAFTPTSVRAKSAVINLVSDDPATPTATQIWGVGK
ncbi:MAG TPA: TIGR03768 family metallophosphoesterase [Syntrophorhabdaceae bacterium]